MENASKALLMAAGVLIGILILTLAVYLFVTFGMASAELHEENDANRLNQFNTQFTSYEGKQDITIYNVITVANIATENNIYYDLPKVSSIITNNKYPDMYVQVTLNGKPIEGGRGSGKLDYTSYIKKDTQKINNTTEENLALKTYSCKTYISSVTQRVYRVDFK